ncbi:MAG: hypothetical protein E7452_03325 [Ruminococcaceae bacterium]|nr:hypothetical protein [Oscillospiraceae bacterium]
MFAKEPKTVYDPKIYADEEIQHWGWEAMAEGISAGRISGKYIVGKARNGLEFVGHIDITNNIITNFYPIVKE